MKGLGAGLGWADRGHPVSSFSICSLGNPRFPLKGSFKGDIDIDIDIDIDT